MLEPLSVGFYPFWFWNATLDADEIRRQIAEMADKGVRGFFIHSRQGLGQPYLSESYFEMVGVAIAAAEAHAMVVHLYDEYPYPSGIAGGEVVLGNPQFHATQLVQRSYELAAGHVRLELPAGKVLSCMAFPVVDGSVDWERGMDLRAHVGMVLTHDSYNEMGLTQYNRKRYFASEPAPTLEVDLPPGSDRAGSDRAGSDRADSDRADSDRAGAYRLLVAVQAEVTHHKYWNHFVDPLNAEAIRYFIELTHERYFARFGDKFGSVIRSIYVDETAPGWSALLPAAFEAATGRDLLPLLPALQDVTHPEHFEVSTTLQQVRYDLFCEAFESQISSWCHAHGIAYSGEKGSLRMAQLRYMDIPGCDPGHTKVGVRPDWLRAPLRRNAKSTASAAYFYGKTGALCECYHSLGWSATLQDAKTIADGLLLAGIRYLVPHGFFYSTHGLVKHDAPPTFFFQMPFWPMFGHLSEHIRAIGEHFEGTHIDAQILVVDLVSGLPSRDKLDAYADVFEELLWALMRRHLDFHVVDNDILADGALLPGGVKVADIEAQVVIVPPMQVIEPELSAWLAAFEAGGGRVVRVALDTDLDAALAPVAERVPPSLSITTGDQEAGDIVAVKRVGEGRTLWFALNLAQTPLSVTLQSAGGLREVPLDAGQPSRLRLEDGHYVRDVAPFEAFMLASAAAEALAPLPPVVTVALGGPAEVRPENDNLLRLGTWQMALRGAGGAYGPAVPVQTMPLANQLSASGLPFAPEIRHYFGHVPELGLPELHVRYAVTFDCAYDGPVALVMEPGSLRGDWSIALNAAPLLTAADFTPTTAHVRGSLGVDITAALRPGSNTLWVDVITDRLDGGLLNPLYLSGQFGVALAPLGLVAPTTDGAFERYVDNLLPHYAGVVAYTLHFDLTEVPESSTTRVALETEAPFHEAVEVAINEGAFVPVLWEPRRIEVPTSLLCVGENRLRVRVFTSLIRSFEGQWFDTIDHVYRDVGEG